MTETARTNQTMTETARTNQTMTEIVPPFPYSPPPSGGFPTLCNHTRNKINSEDRQLRLQFVQQQPQHSSSHLQPDIRRNLQYSPHTCKEIIGDIYNTVTVHTLAPVPRHQSTHLQRDIRRHLQHSQHTCKETDIRRHQSTHLQRDIRRHLQHSPHICKETDIRRHLQHSPHTCKETDIRRHLQHSPHTCKETDIRQHLQYSPHTCKETFGDTYNTVYNTPAARHSSTPAIQSTHLQRDIQRHLQYSQHTRKETIGDTSLHTRKETFGDTYNTVHTPATRHSATARVQHDTDLQLTTLSVVKEGARGMVRGGMPGAFSAMLVPRTSV